jgi:hypothetical protein
MVAGHPETQTKSKFVTISSMRVSGRAALLAVATALAPACASMGSGTGADDGSDGSMGSHDATGPSPDAIALGIEAGDDVVLGGKSCQGLADGTPCGPAPDTCHDAPTCAQGACGAAPAKTDGFVCEPAPDKCHDGGTCAGGKCGAPPTKADGTDCAPAPDACHDAATCSAGKCAAPADRADGSNWSTGDATAICCTGKEVHASTDSDCGACGIVCNASNGESCQILGGHYFCRGCVASAACWSHCCSTSFSPFSCAASDCAGNCSSTDCPPGTHCVSGGTTSSDYCSY